MIKYICYQMAPKSFLTIQLLCVYSSSTCG